MALAAATCPLENDLSLAHPLPSLVQSAPVAGKPPRRHPAALWVLSSAEGGERFGFFLMLAVFTLFLNERLGFAESHAAEVYGFYLTAVNAMPILGSLFSSGTCTGWTMRDGMRHLEFSTWQSTSAGCSGRSLARSCEVDSDGTRRSPWRASRCLRRP